MLYEYSKFWNLNFNAIKCKVISFTRSLTPINFNYHMNGIPLENVSTFNDLGVSADQSLLFRNHIFDVIKKCNKVNGMIRHSIGYTAPASVTIKLYKALIQPIVEYASPVWSPFTKIQIESVERIQRSFTRYALHYPAINYKERCECLNILPLSFRREKMDLKLLFKSLFLENFSNNVADLLTPHVAVKRLRSSENGLLFYPRLVRTETFKGFYSNRVVRLWNVLPIELRQEQSLDSFVNLLNIFYHSKFNDTFNCDDVCSWTSTCRCQACA